MDSRGTRKDRICGDAASNRWRSPPITKLGRPQRPSRATSTAMVTSRCSGWQTSPWPSASRRCRCPVRDRTVLRHRGCLSAGTCRALRDPPGLRSTVGVESAARPSTATRDGSRRRAVLARPRPRPSRADFHGSAAPPRLRAPDLAAVRPLPPHGGDGGGQRGRALLQRVCPAASRRSGRFLARRRDRAPSSRRLVAICCISSPPR